jgi:hypothetical protein
MLNKLTTAPGTTAPEGSVTVPLIAPVVALWAIVCTAEKLATVATTTNIRTIHFIRM